MYVYCHSVVPMQSLFYISLGIRLLLVWLILFVGTGIASHQGSRHQEPGCEASAAVFHCVKDVHKKLVCVYSHNKLRAKTGYE